MALRLRCIAAVAALNLVLTGCGSLIAGYDADAYKTATSLKAEVDAEIDVSNEAYASHDAEVRALSTKIDAAYEYAAGLPHNQISKAQWTILKDPNGGLYGGFVRLWQREGQTGAVYRTEKKKEIDQAFDFIICLEVNKQQAESCKAAAAEATP